MRGILLVFVASVCLASCSFFNAEKVSYQRTYYKSGGLQVEQPFVGGKAHGLKKEYYERGQIRLEVPYVQGYTNGVAKFYHPDGVLYSETPWAKGKIDGVVKKYHKNGKLLSETPYLQNELQPGLREFTEKGDLREPYKLKFTLNKVKRSSDVLLVVDIDIDPSVTKAEFFQQVSGMEGDDPFVRIPSKNNFGQLTLPLIKGNLIDKKIVFKAQFTTRYNNNGVVTDTFHLKVANP